jgi:histidinol phosphatase-like PHP family hydrolase
LAWPIEASQLLGDGVPLTTLSRVGPFVAGVIESLIAADDGTDIDPLRLGFLTRSEVTPVLAESDLGRHVRADFQVHSLWSDGHDSIGAMADAAAGLGREYIVVTDHSKGLPIAGGKDEAAFARQRLEIEAENARLAGEGSAFRVLAGIEMNLSPAGEGDMDPDVLGSMDLVLGAFHSKLRLREDQTERYVAALRNPFIDVLAHPRGRMFNFRLGLVARWEAVFEEAERRGVAVEIDGYPDRQDLDVGLLRLAADAGVLISLGSDAHARVDLPYLDYAMAAAVIAGIPRDRIINTMRPDELRDWTSGRRG